MDSSIVNHFKDGKVGIFPTDTAFGIGCRMDDVKAVQRVYGLRNRPAEKALLVLVSSLEMALQYVTVADDVKEKLIDMYWPGGITLILPCDTAKVPSIVRAGGPSLAVRLPNHLELLSIIQSVGVPIVAPSANFSGEPTPYTLEEVNAELKSKVDFVMNGVCTMKEVSTIVDCTVTPWEVVRQGAVRIDV